MTTDLDNEAISLIEPQRVAIKNILTHKDVVVQSPTGSGKTLAYLIPLFTLLLRIKKLSHLYLIFPTWPKNETGAVVLVPTRELAYQVSKVCQPFADTLNITLSTCIGHKSKKNSNPVEDLGYGMTNNLEVVVSGSVVVATPGRLQILLKSEGVKKALKSLELLIVDETDRFVEMGITASVSEIMGFVPKQRRTGLFSATQPKEMDDVISFCLRNPVFINLSGETDPVKNLSEGKLTTPSSLQNYVAVVNGEEKLCGLLEFVRANPDAKMLIFFSTCRCVMMLGKRKVFSIHGKNRHGKNSELDKFRETAKSVLLCTDVLSRGIDIPDIDWVVHFDIPKCSSWFVHRSGRSARNGRTGKSLLLMSPEQTGYVQFLENYEKVKLNKLNISTCTAAKADCLRNKLIKLASSDRDFLELGTGAFVSFISSYLRHDCNVVCPLDDLDVVGYAHAYGLLRIPFMKEFKGKDFSSFKSVDIQTSSIPFKKAEKEKKRQIELAKRLEERALRKSSKTVHSDKKTAVGKKRKHPKEEKSWEDMASDIALLKKFKRGRLSKKELNEKFYKVEIL
uniref:ATP-dependent RNA helicase n=1 Tax=Syphacia muris TaxID=451379 RepID=A0A0N5AE35_9BILA